MGSASAMASSWLIFVLLAVSCYGYLPDNTYLSVSGNQLIYRNKWTFLSGMNLAWFDYGNDFGTCKYANYASTFNSWLDKVREGGGNSIRVWLHMEGGLGTPDFDYNHPESHYRGYVTRLSRCGDAAAELRSLLDAARARDILVFPTLFNFAIKPHWTLEGLVIDKNKLYSYIDKALKPLVVALKDHPALGGWDVANEPEGALNPYGDGNACYDGSKLSNSGAGFAGRMFSMKQLLAFTGAIAGAIHKFSREAHHKHLVTVGSWSERPQTDKIGGIGYNYYKDNCLRQAVSDLASSDGRFNDYVNDAYIDFYQIHTYENGGRFWNEAPMNHNYDYYMGGAAYQKPLVIGEISYAGSDKKRSMPDIVRYIYSNGYHGVWTWQARGDIDKEKGWGDGREDRIDEQKNGLAAIRSNGGVCLMC